MAHRNRWFTELKIFGIIMDSGCWFGTWLLFSPIVGMMIQSDFHIFQRGWNHQPEYVWNMLFSIKPGWIWPLTSQLIAVLQVIHEPGEDYISVFIWLDSAAPNHPHAWLASKPDELFTHPWLMVLIVTVKIKHWSELYPWDDWRHLKTLFFIYPWYSQDFLWLFP